VNDLWYYSLSLLPCVAAHAEARKDPVMASVVAGLVPGCQQNERIRINGSG
jgi:hypothetical protein